MHSEPLLVATETREKLARSVEPFVAAVLDRLDARGRELAEGRIGIEANGKRYVCRVVAFVQAHPALLRVALVGLPRAVELERFEGELVPGLAEAADDVLAGVLASLGNGADVAIAAATAQRAGGFLIAFDLESGDIKAYVAKAGEDLGRAIEIGGIVGASQTAH